MKHDRSVCVIIDGKVAVNIANERLDRVKYSASPEIPYAAVDTALKFCRHPQQISSFRDKWKNKRKNTHVPDGAIKRKMEFHDEKLSGSIFVRKFVPRGRVILKLFIKP